jgi:hypothetical protein
MMRTDDAAGNVFRALYEGYRLDTGQSLRT